MSQLKILQCPASGLLPRGGTRQDWHEDVTAACGRWFV